MTDSYSTPARSYAAGMGDAVADRTINRKLPNGNRERWADVAKRVATGNALLNAPSFDDEFHAMHHHLRQASLLMSGRHLQHGDDTQPTRPQEVFTNCSTSAASFLTFYLLLNGSGVGRAYDDAMMKVDWRKMPLVVPVIDYSHKDVVSGEVAAMPLVTARHFYANRRQELFEVPDSREGWAKAVEQIERMAFEGTHRDTVLLIDFNKVRPRNSPIAGMQGRPASGPGPLIEAIRRVSTLREAGMAPWRSALYADHYLAECVLVGGARRAARMATKNWRDKSALEFIAVKQGGHLWSANNSITVDAKFWRYVRKVQEALGRGKVMPITLEDKVDRLVDLCLISDLEAHAYKVFEAVCRHSYYDGTGEPGLINQDKLHFNPDGIDTLMDGEFAGSLRYQLDESTKALTRDLAKAFTKLPYKMIVNPCGEIPLTVLGGYCVIADVVPYHADPAPGRAIRGDTRPRYEAWDADAVDAFRVATRALMRVNLMDSLYAKEVKRTNRIGVGMTGIHEYAFARFGFGWKDLVDEQKSLPFWQMLSTFCAAVQDEAKSYAKVLGVAVPHTVTTIKPAGTTSKLFGLTEGAHLPSMREFLRWVQFRSDDPLVADYKAKGYPVRELQSYGGTTIVGFPTQPEICRLGMGDKLVTAAEATPEEQYQFLRLLEKWWIRGQAFGQLGKWTAAALPDMGGQVSYTLKYKPNVVSYDEFRRTLLDGQSSIKACSVMPQTDGSAYEYQPEQAVARHEYEAICKAIEAGAKEDVAFEHVDCASGACPISFNENGREAA